MLFFICVFSNRTKIQQNFKICQFSSVTQSCPTLCDPMNRSTPGLPVHQQLPEFTQTHVHQVSPSSHLIHCRPLLLLPPIPPSIRVFSNESTLCNPMDSSTPCLPVHHQFLDFTQTYVHRVGDAIQPSHPLSSPSPPALNLSQHQSLFKCQLFASGGQRIGVSASTSVLPIIFGTDLL